MTKKGVFPYEYLDSLERLEDSSFPSRQSFFNKLNNEECMTKNYLHAKHVWNSFNCKTFKDYHDLYIKNDMYLLADFFEKFRSECMEGYGLDAAHYYTAPGMAWNAD